MIVCCILALTFATKELLTRESTCSSSNFLVLIKLNVEPTGAQRTHFGTHAGWQSKKNLFRVQERVTSLRHAFICCKTWSRPPGRPLRSGLSALHPRLPPVHSSFLHTFWVLKSAFSVYFLHLYKQTLDDCFFFFGVSARAACAWAPPAANWGVDFINAGLIFHSLCRFEISHWTVRLARATECAAN